MSRTVNVPVKSRTRAYLLRLAVDAFPEALAAVGAVLHAHQATKGTTWREQPWRTHAAHERAHVIGADVLDDRGGEPAAMEEHQTHGTCRGLMRLQRYLDTRQETS